MARVADEVTDESLEVIAKPEPAEPSTTGAPDKVGFFQQLSEYTQAQWEKLIIYVYRLAPITDRRATGNKSVYARKYVGPVDEDQLKIDLGSGIYRLQLNKVAANGKSSPIRQQIVDIEDVKFPPVVPEGEWVDDPANKRWAWCRKKEDAAVGANSNAGGWSPEAVMKFVRELRPDAPKEDHMSITKAVLDAVKETRASMQDQNDPMKLITMITQIVNMSKPAEAPRATGPDPVLTILTQMLETSNKRLESAEKAAAEDRKEAAAERQRQHELQLKAMETRANGTNPVEMLKQMKELQALAGGNEPDTRNWKEKLVDEGMQYVPQLLEVAGKFVGRPAYQPGAQSQQPRPQQPNASAVSEDTARQQPQQSQPQGELVEMPISQDPEICFLYPIFLAKGGDLVNFFKSDPTSGPLVADLVRTMGGAATYERIAQMGVDRILATIKLIPQMEADFAGAGSADMLRTFIEDFVGDDEDDDDEPVIPEAGKPAKQRKAKQGAPVQ